MSDGTCIDAGDRLLTHHIAVLMRWGTLTTSVLLVCGALLAWGGLAPASSVLIATGCANLVALPLLRLVLMLVDFARRADTPYVGIVLLVIILIVVTAATGVII